MISSVAKGEKPGKGHKVGGGEQVEVGHSIVAAILAVGKVKALLPLLLPYYLHRIPKGSAAQRKKIKERKKNLTGLAKSLQFLTLLIMVSWRFFLILRNEKFESFNHISNCYLLESKTVFAELAL